MNIIVFYDRGMRHEITLINDYIVAIELDTRLPDMTAMFMGQDMSDIDTSDWKLFYSNDDKVWIEAPETFDLAEQKNKDGDVKNSVYPFGTFTVSNDLKIIACAIDIKNNYPEDEVVFITNDLDELIKVLKK